MPTLQRWVQPSTLSSSVSHRIETDNSQVTLAQSSFYLQKPSVLFCCSSRLLHSPPPVPTPLLYPIIKFLSSCSPSPSHIPQVLTTRLKMFFKDSSPQFSCCRSLSVWSKLDSLQSSFSKKKNDTRGGWCFWQSSRGSDFIPWANFTVLQHTFSFTKSDPHISCCSCFPQDSVGKRCFSTAWE